MSPGDRPDPDPALGGLDEELWFARQAAADEGRPRSDRRDAALYAVGLAKALRVLTGRELEGPPVP